jgi:predicted urease superfamily metal-dependent hydrolase
MEYGLANEQSCFVTFHTNGHQTHDVSLAGSRSASPSFGILMHAIEGALLQSQRTGGFPSVG